MLLFFREGGGIMYPILLLGIGGLLVGGTAFGAKSRGAAVAGLALAAVTMLLGVGGMMRGRMITDDALAMVEPTVREELRAQGYKESTRPLQLGGALALLGLALSAGAFAATGRTSPG